MLYTWGAADEASRNGARFAVICDDTANKAKVLARMKGILPQIGDINLAWNPARLHDGHLRRGDGDHHQSQLPVDISYCGGRPHCCHTDADFLDLPAARNNEARPCGSGVRLSLRL
jgi:hypothetical protein